jgi:hypothetical protein
VDWEAASSDRWEDEMKNMKRLKQSQKENEKMKRQNANFEVKTL